MWTLIIAIHVGAMCSGNSNAITTVDGFKSKAACEIAGAEASHLMDGTCKEVRFKCLLK